LLNKVYEPFFSTKKSGTGLGLAIVHRICAALKLQLHLESRSGLGTTFTVEFLSYSPDRSQDVPAAVAADPFKAAVH